MPRLSKAMVSRTIALLLLLGAGVWTTSCGLDQKGMVLFLDRSYHATVLGTDQDGFSVPDGIRWRQGRLYIADEGGSAFRIWDGPGRVNTLSDAKDGVLSPEDIAIDGEGNVYFTDDDAGGVWKIDRSGETRQLAGKEQGVGSTEGIVIAPNGNLLVGDAEAHKVLSISPAGDVADFLGPEYAISKPESMAFDDKGNLYIADNDARVVYLLTQDMVLHRVINDREGFSPETIWFSNGALYITDSDHGKLFRYVPNTDLEPIAVFGGKLSKVHGITSDEAGALYVSIQSDLLGKKGYILKIERGIDP